ncbi:hypothetical protein [Streptomyces zingiberis]|uniref:Uncharacterized protein n=1 Tax=Streptomyces zingiberis TaxID=2053010 RepID=A0ABX1BSS9_9ACTN|nr:hypothetical protein [Streptomyces zingiberis]NJQ00143.1 hypothetical protein [Streptomyces zingiberis]
MAIPALLGAARADRLRAALEAVPAATAAHGEEYPALIREVWSRLPEVREVRQQADRGAGAAAERAPVEG